MVLGAVRNQAHGANLGPVVLGAVRKWVQRCELGSSGARPRARPALARHGAPDTPLT